MFDNDKRFIGQDDAMEYYMGASTRAFARFDRAMAARDVSITMRAGTFLYGIPEHVANSICDNSQTGANSRLKGHFKRDIVRNISEAVVYDLYAEQLESTGRIAIQIAFDEKGNPIGDAANITTSIVDEMKAFDGAYGQDGEVEVNTKKIEFSPMGKEPLFATSESVKRMSNMAQKTPTTPVQ